MTRVRSYLALFLSFGVLNGGDVYASDYSGDGVGDLAFISIDNSGNLDWDVFAPLSGQSVGTLSDFGVNGDHIISAPWSVSAGTNPGVISKDATTGLVSWIVRNGTGGIDQKQFGKSSDLFVAGGDFNGNGTADAVIGRARGSRMEWIIRRDYFAIAMPQAKQRNFQFGNKSGDTFFYMNFLGTGDVMGLLRTTGSVRHVFLRSFFNSTLYSGKLSSTLKFNLRPLPLKQTNGIDLLAFVQKGDTESTVTVYEVMRTSGKSSSLRLVQRAKGTVPSGGEVVVGSFTGAGVAEEVGFYQNSALTVFTPATSAVVQFSVPNAIVADDINLNTFSSTGGGGDNGGSCEDETLSPSDGGYGFLWKPVSDSTGKLAVHLPSKYAGKFSSCAVVASDNTVIENGNFGGNGNGGRDLYRFSKKGSSYPVGAKVVATTKSGGCKVSWGPINKPSNRID